MNDPTLSRNVRRGVNHGGRRHRDDIARTSRSALARAIATASWGRSRTARGRTARSSSRTTATLVAAIAAIAALAVAAREEAIQDARVAALVAAIATVV